MERTDVTFILHITIFTLTTVTISTFSGGLRYDCITVNYPLKALERAAKYIRDFHEANDIDIVTSYDCFDCPD